MAGRFSAVQNVPGVHPASHTVGMGSFPRVKRPVPGVGHPPLPIAEVKERIELYLCSPAGPSCPVVGLTIIVSVTRTLLLLPSEIQTDIVREPYERALQDFCSFIYSTVLRPTKTRTWTSKATTRCTKNMNGRVSVGYVPRRCLLVDLRVSAGMFRV